MVIIGIAFSMVLPLFNLIYKANRSLVIEREFNQLFKVINEIKAFPWDEQNKYTLEILIPQSLTNPCIYWKEKSYRIGGFINSRNCKHKIPASNIFPDGKDDIDDFNNYSIPFKKKEIKVKVFYANENLLPSFISTNIKLIEVSLGKLKLSYPAYNIGYTQVQTMEWNATLF